MYSDNIIAQIIRIINGFVKFLSNYVIFENKDDNVVNTLKCVLL